MTRLIRWFKSKIKLNGFIGGLIFGAFFSLLVNVATFYVSDAVAKQRALESIENEITSNNILANVIVNQNNKSIGNNDLPNLFYSYHRYTESVWNNPSTLSYIEQLDPIIQAQISTYYQYVITGSNAQIDKLELLSGSILQKCFTYTIPLDTQTDKACRLMNGAFLNMESNSALSVSSTGLKLINIFHPTRDRLKNPLLRLLMGGNAIGALKVPPNLNGVK